MRMQNFVTQFILRYVIERQFFNITSNCANKMCESLMRVRAIYARARMLSVCPLSQMACEVAERDKCRNVENSSECAEFFGIPVTRSRGACVSRALQKGSGGAFPRSKFSVKLSVHVKGSVERYSLLYQCSRMAGTMVYRSTQHYER